MSGSLANIPFLHQDGTSVRIIKPHQKVDKGGLAAAGGANDGYLLSRFRLEIQMLYEKYSEQHAVGINTWFEIDAKVENTQKIAALALS